MHQVSVSFIIPAYNEELFLPQVLKNIHLYMPASLSYEVIVADNGSSDHTVELARAAGAVVIVDKNAFIGGLRNLAVEQSSGQVLVFLDADILLTDKWRQNFLQVYQSLLENPVQITGSRYGIPTPASWIELVWFKPLIAQPSKYINSGHLITSRELFNRINGFDASLETGEDYAFGMASRAINAEVVNNPDLMVVHKGYPKTIYQFMRREMWHGRGDCESLQSVLSSKVAVTAMFVLILHLLIIVNLLFTGSALMSGILLIIIGSLCLAAAIFKHKARTLKNVIMTTFLYYLYFISRAFSWLSLLSARTVKRKEVD